MKADAKPVPFMLQQTRAAVKPEARQTAWVHPHQPSSQTAVLQTQEKSNSIKNMRARVIQLIWESRAASSQPHPLPQPAVRVLPEGSHDSSRRQSSLQGTRDLRARTHS